MFKFFYAFLPILLWTNTSFAQLNYAPNNIHIPVLDKRFDGDFLLGINQGNSLNGLEIQGCFSPFKHILVAGHYLASGNSGDINSNDFGAKYRFAEVAIGGYKPFPTGSMSLLAGLGEGNINNAYGQNRKSDLRFNRLFIQPGIAIRKNIFAAAAAMRFNYLAYPFGSVDFAIDETDLFAIQIIDKEAPLFVPELGLQTGVYLRPFQILIHLNTIFVDMNNLDFSMFNIGLSVGIDLGDIRPEKKKKGKNK